MPRRAGLRLLADRDGRVVVDPGPAVAAARAEAIEPVTVPGGLGAHKWRDRRWIDALADAVAPAHPLLVDLDGLVLEAGAAAVLAVVGGTLVAPPLDGRILPSVTRTVALRRARAAGVPVAIRPLLRDEMGSASELILAARCAASGCACVRPGHSGDRGPGPGPCRSCELMGWLELLGDAGPMAPSSVRIRRAIATVAA